MQIQVNTTGIISKKINRGRQFVLELDKGDQIADLITKLDIPEKELPFMMFYINGSNVRRDYILKAEDRVKILPIVGGG